MRKGITHKHHYAPHPNPDWSTHAYCTICGFAVLKGMLTQSAVSLDQLSPELREELERREAIRIACEKPVPYGC